MHQTALVKRIIYAVSFFKAHFLYVVVCSIYIFPMCFSLIWVFFLLLSSSRSRATKIGRGTRMQELSASKSRYMVMLYQQQWTVRVSCTLIFSYIHTYMQGRLNLFTPRKQCKCNGSTAAAAARAATAAATITKNEQLVINKMKTATNKKPTTNSIQKLNAKKGKRKTKA